MFNWLTRLDVYKCKQAFKSALAATLATLITLAAHMPHPFWAPAIVIMLMDDYSEGSFKKGMTRFVSTLAGAVFAYFIGHFTLSNEIIYYLSLFTVISIVIYGVLVSSTAWLNFGVTFLFLTMYMVMDPSGSFEVAIWRSSEILTGVLCGALISSFVFPSNLMGDIENQVKAIISGSQSFLTQMQQNLANSTELSWQNDKMPFRTALQKLTTLLTLLSANGKQGEVRSNLGVLIDQGWRWWRQSGQLYEVLAQDDQLKTILLPLLKDIDQLFQAWITCLNDHKTLEPSLESLTQQIETALKPIANQAMSTTNTAHYVLLQNWLNNLESWLGALKQFIEHDALETIPTAPQSLRATLHRFYIKLMSKKSLLPHCFAIAIGCCIVTYIWLLTGWPGGVCAGISALVVGADSSLTKINLKIRLRLLGSVIGSVIGLLVFIFLVGNVISLLAAVFIGVFVFAYMSQNGFSSMYISWMATMGYVITVVPDLKHITDISFPFERSFGLVMGLVVMAFVVNFFWPLNANKQFKELCDNVRKKFAVTWSYLKNINQDNAQKTHTNIQSIQVQLSDLISQGNALAKPAGLMKQWSPVIQTIVTLPWCVNYLTLEALDFLNTTFPNQWQTLTEQTIAAIKDNDKTAIKACEQQWQQWSDKLEHYQNETSQQDTIAQCWLMLKSNKQFCNVLTKMS